MPSYEDLERLAQADVSELSQGDDRSASDEQIAAKKRRADQAHEFRDTLLPSEV